jgi:hypothetical protein
VKTNTTKLPASDEFSFTSVNSTLGQPAPAIGQDPVQRGDSMRKPDEAKGNNLVCEHPLT